MVLIKSTKPISSSLLIDLGADEIISLSQADDMIVAQVLHHETPNDIVDYLWGHPVELLISALKGKGSFTHRTRLVSVGNMAGELIQLSASTLRHVDLTLAGSGLGSLSKRI